VNSVFVPLNFDAFSNVAIANTRFSSLNTIKCTLPSLRVTRLTPCSCAARLFAPAKLRGQGKDRHWPETDIAMTSTV